MNFNGNLNTVTLVVNQDNIGQIDRRRLRGDGGEVGQKGATQSQYKSPFIVFSPPNLDLNPRTILNFLPKYHPLYSFIKNSFKSFKL